MKRKINKKVDVDQIIIDNFAEIEQVKEQKLINLFIKIIVEATLKEFYEKGNKISEIQSNWTE